MRKVAKGLPEECFAVIPGNDELVVIVRGERGYHPIEERALKLLHRGEPAEEARDRLNTYADVTKKQAAAMLTGSICGWDVKAADPANLDKCGRLLK